MTQTRTAFIAIVGCPNVGKSSILNRLLGQKIAVVSPKPQTTRTKIMGVFTDTPGFHRPRTKLGEKMVKAVSDSISGVDACLFVVEPSGELRDAERDLLGKFKKEKMPVILAINKIDSVKQKELLIERMAQFSALYDELFKQSQPSPHFFPDDTLTDQPERVIAAEIIREKLLNLLDDEVPHGVAVCIERMHEREDSDITDIDATVYCERESHKGIIIGKKGEMLKKVSTRAREDMERFFMCKINLHCWVKVKEGWRNREGLIRNFGLDNE